MAETWDDKAIKGSDLQTVLTEVYTDMNAKQDALDVSYDPSNLRISFNNVAIVPTNEA